MSISTPQGTSSAEKIPALDARVVAMLAEDNEDGTGVLAGIVEQVRNGIPGNIPLQPGQQTFHPTVEEKPDPNYV